jgi:hypothetical protein
MSAESARIHNTRALMDAKAALVKFAEEAGAAIASMDSDVQRISIWLGTDRPYHWKKEIRRREDLVAKARAEISRKQIVRAPEPASIVEERRALQRAQQYLEEAQRRAEATRRWASRWERDAMMYKGSVAGLCEALARDIPMACARLDRMADALEAYQRIAPPTTEQPPEPDAAPGGA